MLVASSLSDNMLTLKVKSNGDIEPTVYTRTSPSGDNSLIQISSQESFDYHKQLAESGFVYEEVKDDSPNICESCHA